MYKKLQQIISGERRNEVPISSHMYGSPRRYSNSSEFLKSGKKLKYIFIAILGLGESFKTMNRPEPTVTLFDGLIVRKYKR